ncbi:MAG: hypothetical protein KDA75_10850 [Planctomycetaceae bacterium]|nr:hypothetical protein [Planctomycetaceae bacterium]
MPSVGLDPALSLSLRLQGRGRFRRLGQSFATPRRMALTLSAAVLAFIWMGNVILSILFREPYGPGQLEQWARVGLTVYALWHVIRTAWERPLQNLEWSPAEEEFLVSGPFSRRALVKYRLMSIGSSAVLKATVATALLLPDLNVPWLGLLGLCLALYTVELIRVGLDTLTSALSPVEYTIYRLGVLTTASAAGAWMLTDAIGRWPDADASQMPALVAFLTTLTHSVQAFAATPVFTTISSVFGLFVQLLTSPRFEWSVLGQLAIAAAGTWLLMEAVLRLDAVSVRRRRRNEMLTLEFASRRTADEPTLDHGPLPRVALGAVAWRQYLGARSHASGVLLALVAPAMLSLLPFLMLDQETNPAFANFIASLGFYTLLLLPPALKFDFRRDFDRLLALKMLPVSPWRVALGQIAIPVLIATIFQWSMILTAYIARPVAADMVVAALVLFLPANVAIFGLDNFLFLLFPHRLQQEGIDVFLRTTLVFTAKGIVFAILLAGVLLWSVAANAISIQLVEAGWAWCGPIAIFGVGLWLLVAVAAFGIVALTAHAFRHFDPARGAVA